jgi:hypothetical protein
MRLRAASCRNGRVLADRGQNAERFSHWSGSDTDQWLVLRHA